MSTVWSPRDEHQPYYRTLLRPLGAYLDTVGARSVTIVETLDGFLARFAIDLGAPSLNSVEFSTAELHAADDKQRAHRTAMSDHLPIRSTPPALTNYQQVLRSLGHELDRLRAYGIAIDELDGEFVLTYNFQDPFRGLDWRKRMALVGPSEQERFQHEAESRRKPAATKRRVFFH